MVSLPCLSVKTVTYVNMAATGRFLPCELGNRNSLQEKRVQHVHGASRFLRALLTVYNPSWAASLFSSHGIFSWDVILTKIPFYE